MNPPTPTTKTEGKSSAMSMSETRKKHYVDHTYRDCSRFLEQGGQIPDHKKSLNNFPKKLHLMLSNPELSHIITWMPHGRCWKVLDRVLLIKEGNPTYFSQSKFESFTRQLSTWGFKRLHRPGRDKGCYYHECCLRGLPQLTELMRRVVTNQGKALPCPEGEPDFYSIARSYPLPPEDENRVVSAATSQSVPSNTVNETTRHSLLGISSEGATAVAALPPCESILNALERARSTRRELMSGVPNSSGLRSIIQEQSSVLQAVVNSSSMASLSSSSIPRSNNSASAATSETQSSGVSDHDLQVVRSYYQGETNRPQLQPGYSAETSFPFQAPPGESTSCLNYQYQAQASASNNSFHRQPHSSCYKMDSPYLSYPENDYAFILAASSGDRYGQDNNSSSNASTYPSEEAFPQPSTHASSDEPEQEHKDIEANNGNKEDGKISVDDVNAFLERFELQHGGTETNNEVKKMRPKQWRE